MTVKTFIMFAKDFYFDKFLPTPNFSTVVYCTWGKICGKNHTN